MVKNRRIWRKRRTWVDWILNIAFSGPLKPIRVCWYSQCPRLRMGRELAASSRINLFELAVRERQSRGCNAHGCKVTIIPSYTQIFCDIFYGLMTIAKFLFLLFFLGFIDTTYRYGTQEDGILIWEQTIMNIRGECSFHLLNFKDHSIFFSISFLKEFLFRHHNYLYDRFW